MEPIWECACGFRRTDLEATRQAHAAVHLAWWEGVSVPWANPEPFEAITSEDVWARRRLAYDLGRLYRREMGYDFDQFPRHRPWPTQFALVAIDQSFRRGVAIVLWHPGKGWIGLQDRVRREDEVVTVDGIWVCGERRRRGVGRLLLEELARRWGITVAKLAFTTPFSKSGGTLIRSLVPEAEIRMGVTA